MTSSSRKYDIVLYGITGYTGGTTARYLLEHAPPSLRLAVAGRSKEKVEAALHRALDDSERWKREQIGVIVADASSKESIDSMVSQTRVIIARSASGLTISTELLLLMLVFVSERIMLILPLGESIWVRKMIDCYHEPAKQKGIIIVPACGFDSVPSDLITYIAAGACGTDVVSVNVTLASISGGVSRGTLDSIAGIVSTPISTLLSFVANPFYLNPAGIIPGNKDRPFPLPLLYYNNDFKTWQVPFVMAVANGPVVRRTHALLGYPFGRFAYVETQSVPNILVALITLYFAWWASVLFAIPPVLWFCQRFLFPAPGTGRTTGVQGSGHVELKATATNSTGKKVHATFYGPSDPGYAETPKYVAECALALVTQRNELPGAANLGGGVLTPASAFGDVLVNRLKAAGNTIVVE
ncbi:hypothetical protein HDU93_009477 [Gonapodya sp. JEL0774]|nr:hypothetical protein HDU93_009477 [Gonapodya sp. JEL0774]